MLRGFQVVSVPDGLSESSRARGESSAARQKKEVHDLLDQFISPNGAISASSLSAEWFPMVPADVFISHSHHDEALALRLAGWLEERFGLRVFVDSVVWKSADVLLNVIDKQYCKTDDGKYFDYKKRNLSTSHIHMMLVMAIAQMMHDTEAFFLLSTPKALSVEDLDKEKLAQTTPSPWIFAEMVLSKLIRSKPVDMKRRALLEAKASMENALDSVELVVAHKVPVKHLTPIDRSVFNRWSAAFTIGSREDALDMLYRLAPPVAPQEV
ncbi:hypothetical protein [Xanthomonas phaseoli]|uniref:hypothetical protein n=1 Tax=Xanthomonas phaseoli TaxID=1985254 RepID=UPI00351B73E3